MKTEKYKYVHSLYYGAELVHRIWSNELPVQVGNGLGVSMIVYKMGNEGFVINNNAPFSIITELTTDENGEKSE